MPALPLPEQDDLLHSWVKADVLRMKLPIERCLWRFAAWGRALGGVIAFKFGICYDFVQRWQEYGSEEMWLFMDVMHAGFPEECRQLEMSLIEKTHRINGCYNIAKGGEGVRAGNWEGTVYCYAVYAMAGHGRSVRRAWFDRQSRRRG